MAAEPHPDPENGAYCARCGHMWEMHAEGGACQAAWKPAGGGLLAIVECSCPVFVGSREFIGAATAALLEEHGMGVKPFDRPEDDVSTSEPVEVDEYTPLERWLTTPVFRADVVLILFGLFIIWAATR